MEYPLITIGTLCYNTGDKVVISLDTLLQQNYPNIEHIIIDDCSKDNSMEIIEAWIEKNNHKCNFLKNKTNQGICKNLNTIIKLSTANYIAFISDDFWKPNHLKFHVEYLEKMNKNIAFILSRCDVVTDKNVFLGKADIEDNMYFKLPKDINFDKLIKKNFDKNVAIIDGVFFFQTLFFSNLIFSNAVIFRKEILKDLNYYNEKLAFEDLDMSFKICEKYDFAYSKHRTACYVRHEKNITSNAIFNEKILLDKIQILLKYKYKADKIGKIGFLNNITSSYLDLTEYYLSNNKRIKALLYFIRYQTANIKIVGFKKAINFNILKRILVLN